MKKLIIILIFFLSFHVYGNDDLTGKKIVCEDEINDIIYLRGFNFDNNKKVTVWSQTSRQNKPSSFQYYYRTTPTTIDLDVEENSNTSTFIIKRKNLEVDYKLSFENKNLAGYDYKAEKCSIWNGPILNFFYLGILLETQDNKI